MNDSAIQTNEENATSPLLYRWDDIVLSFSPAGKYLLAHYHGAAELVIAPKGRVSCDLGVGRAISASSILIPPGTPHRNEYSDKMSVTIYFDADSRYYKHLVKQMTPVSGVYTAIPRVRELKKQLRLIYADEPDQRVCRSLICQFLANRQHSSDRLGDKRVHLVLEELRQSPASDYPVSYFASLVGLSEDRLHHIFTEAVGLPLHRYRLWLRLKHASDVYFSGRNLTYAAQEAGFSDAAHFSRTFKKMYGSSPEVTLSARRRSPRR